MDEHAISLNGHAVGVSDMSDCEYLGSLDPVDMRLRAQQHVIGLLASFSTMRSPERCSPQQSLPASGE
jgi:hypothetical protein